MDVAKKYEQIGHLRRLAEDPSTTEAEAENAWTRIREIEARIKEEHERDVLEKEKRIDKGRRVTLSALRARKKKQRVLKFETKWPFGWTRRDGIQVSVIPFPLDNKIVLEWECPSCGMIVEKVVTPRHRARLMGRPGGVDKFVGDIRGGKLNQLCDECWEKHQ